MGKISVIAALAILLGACGGLPTLESTQAQSPTLASTPLPTQSQALAMPYLPRYRVTANTLEVRTGPGERFANAGYLYLGDVVSVGEVRASVGNEVCQAWASVGNDKWVCFEFLEPLK
ncbi:MAG: hypothetical protein ACOY4M_08305 [Pseudomonadota bacterium]